MTRPSARARRSSPHALVALVLLATGAAGAWQMQRMARAHQDARFDYEHRRIESAVQERMAAYVQVLRGGLGLFAVDETVRREDWLRYVEHLQLGQRYPGFKSLSFAAAVRPEDLDAFIADVRRQPLPPGLRDPSLIREFRLRSPVAASGDPPIHSPIVFVAPMIPENERVLGVDMMQEPGRRAAMERAAASGDAVLSPRLNLAGQGDRKAGFIAYLAVHRDGALQGWLTAAFLANDFMRGLLGEADADRALDFEVYDGDTARPEALFYSTAGIAADGTPLPLPTVSDRRLERSARLALPGRDWTLRYRTAPGFVPLSDRLAPWLALLGGALAALLYSSTARARDRLREAYDRVAEQATHDPLTGLANRSLFIDRLRSAIGRSRRRHQSFALAYIDIDGFKPVNDQHGHQAGDALLRQIAQRLQARLRDEDTLARLGGDEFAMILEQAHEPPESVQALFANILDSLAAPFTLDIAQGPVQVRIGASTGIALFPRHGDDADALIVAADSAMYRAKRSGEGGCRLAEDAAG